MENYRIDYKKGIYEIIEEETAEPKKIRFKTNSLESLCFLIESKSTIYFELSDKVPNDIKIMLEKYENVRNNK